MTNFFTRFSKSRSGTPCSPNLPVSQEEREESKSDLQERIAAKLLNQFASFPGCGSERHRRDLEEHQAEYPSPSQHSDLKTLFRGAAPPVLGGAQGMPHPALTVDQLRFIYHGQRHRSEEPLQVCMHAEAVHGGEAYVQYDVDSFLGFARTLAFCKDFLQLTCDPSDQRNIHAPLHLDTAHCSTKEDRKSFRNHVDVKKVPHCFLGLANGIASVAVYLLFPHLPCAGEDFYALQGKQRERFVDQVLLPSLRAVLPDGSMIDLPGSYEQATANSNAQHKESRKVSGDAYGRKQDFKDPIQACFLDDLWRHMCWLVDNMPGLQDFQDMQIFFNAKGVKGEHSTTPQKPRLSQCVQRFRDYVERIFDLTAVHKELFFIDLAREVVPTAGDPRTLLWKRCCLEAYLRWLYEDQGAKLEYLGDFFHSAFLRDAANVTTSPKLRSDVARAGVKWIQLYGRWKKEFDAGALFPFANPGLEELALDEQVRKSAANSAGAPARDLKALNTAFQSSSNRVHVDCQAPPKQLSCREEVRMVWDLAMEVGRQAGDRTEEIDGPLDTIPDCYWVVDSRRWKSFIWYATNRLVSSFEFVRSKFRGKRMPWEVTALQAMTLRLLKHQSISSALSREKVLWVPTRKALATGRVWQGLGFKNTMDKYGFCWVLPMIDWRKLRFQGDVDDRILFGNRILREKYRNYSENIRTYVDSSQRLEDCRDWLRRFPGDRQRQLVLEHMAHLCLRDFRDQIFDRVFTDQRCHELGPAPDRETVYLCFDSLRQHGGLEPYIGASNATRIKDPAQMFQLYFGRDDGLENERLRRHFVDRSFRDLFHTAQQIVQDTLKGGASLWIYVFQKELVRYHWLWPQPDFNHGTFLKSVDKRCNSTQIHQPAFWAIQKRQGGKAQVGDMHGYGWASFKLISRKPRALYRPGCPPRYPDHISWSETAWLTWLEKGGRPCSGK